MELDQITSRIDQVMGISALNPMQQGMAQCQAPETLLLAPTGSGKTLAFTIPLLRSLTTPSGHAQALVIAPSRELVMQIADVVRPLALPLRTVALYGGHSMLDESRSLATAPDIIITTPGRLLDHLNRGQLDIRNPPVLVLDEYDKSLELGFLDEMKRIAKRIGKASRVILTSATPLAEMPDFLRLSGPVVMDFTTTAEAPSERMELVRVPSAVPDKIATAIDLAATFGGDFKAIVFVNHRESAERVYQLMKSAGIPAGLYHGGLDQQHREMAIDLLNNGTTPILISTDLASRGLDIANVDAVIHYHLPPSVETWTHRNGRTARQGAAGTVYSIISDGETIPEYVAWDRQYVPPTHDAASTPAAPAVASLYFNAGKREKISRGDIAGYLIQKGGLLPSEIGKIVVRDHYSIAAIPRATVGDVLKAVAPHKLKNRRVRVTRL